MMVTIRARMMKPEARCQRYDDDTRTQHTRHSLQTITPTVLTPSKTNSVAIILCPVPSASALSGCRRQLTDDASSSSNGGMMRRRRRRETRPFGASTRLKRGWRRRRFLLPSQPTVSQLSAGSVFRSVCVLRGKRTPVAAAKWARRERVQ